MFVLFFIDVLIMAHNDIELCIQFVSDKLCIYSISRFIAKPFAAFAVFAVVANLSQSISQ